jgi:hypothetical protein
VRLKALANQWNSSLLVYYPLKQRIVVKHSMSSLQKEELGSYLKTRLEYAGTHEELFTSPSIEAFMGLPAVYPAWLIAWLQTLYWLLVKKSNGWSMRKLFIRLKVN